MIARIQGSAKRAINAPNAPQTRQVTRESMGTQWGHEPTVFQSALTYITLSVNRIRWNSASLSPGGSRDIYGTYETYNPTRTRHKAVKLAMRQDADDSEMTHI